MRQRPLRWTALSALALLGCASVEIPFDGGVSRDGGAVAAMDRGAPGPCVPGRIYCAGTMAFRCDDQGAVIQQTSCGGATSTCVEGLGCRACTPNLAQCDRADPQRVVTCRADGSGFDPGATCNEANGESCQAGRCVSRCAESELGRSYLGCEYWPTVTPNSQLNPGFEFAVVISNPQTYAVRASFSGGALTAPRELTLAPGAIETVILPWVYELSQNTRGAAAPGMRPAARSALRRGGAYRLRTNGPVAAYQFNPLTFSLPASRVFSYTNDASLLLPQGVLTRRYTVSTWPNWSRGFNGFVSIVGVTGESTEVVVRPAAAVSAGTGVTALSPGNAGTYTLQPGDVLQLVSTGPGDLTGTSIESSLPVAVYVGHDCSNVPLDRIACDHLEEQLFPNETWGRNYVVTGLRDRGATTPAIVRIVSQVDGNALTFDPPVLAPRTLRAGEVVELSTAQHFRVIGTRPFLVMQYMIGQGSEDPMGTGDPAMVTEVPVLQYRTQYDFFVPSTYPRNFINIVAPVGAQLALDGAPIPRSTEVVSGQDIYTIPIPAGPHRIRADGEQQFGIKVYGVATFTSYMYPGGLDLRILTPG
jgi:hypothetical protein